MCVQNTNTNKTSTNINSVTHAHTNKPKHTFSYYLYCIIFIVIDRARHTRSFKACSLFGASSSASAVVAANGPVRMAHEHGAAAGNRSRYRSRRARARTTICCRRNLAALRRPRDRRPDFGFQNGRVVKISLVKSLPSRVTVVWIVV